MTGHPVFLGDVPVGDGHPTVLMAEIGTFFNTDVGLARDYIRQIAEAGAPVAKTEILHTADVCLEGTGLETAYRHAGGVAVEDYRALIERKVVPLSDYTTLFSLCRDLSLPVVASVYDQAGVDFVVAEGGAAVKIARNNIDNVPLIRHAARSGLPVLFDTGHATRVEIDRAVELAREAGAADLILNLHPGSNPAPPRHHDLRACGPMKQRYGCPIGLACHYRGEEILYAAVGCGVNLLEKGVDRDPEREEQDLISALPLDRLAEVLDKVRACWEALGEEEPRVPDDPDTSTRAGIVVARPVRGGARFTEADLGYAWPPLGIRAAHWDDVVGRHAKRDLAQGNVLKWEDVEES